MLPTREQIRAAILRGKGGGAGPPMTGLESWWAADAIVGLSDTDPVTTWPDSTGNGHDATEAGSNRPTYRTGIFNSLPAVLFTSASSQRLNFSGITHGVGTEFTVIAVGQILSNVDSMYVGNSSTNIQFRRNTSGSNVTSAYWGVTSQSTAFTTAVGSLEMASFVRDFQGPLWEITHYENKTSKGSPAANMNGSITLNTIGRTSYGNYYNGYIAELLIYQGVAFAQADIDSIYDDYLQPKWGLP